MDEVQHVAATLPTGPDATAPQLSFQDLDNVVKIIDFAAEQGAFKGWSVLTQVKEVRDRIATFVEAVSPPAETADTAAKQ
jgi:hypothetical protein